VAGVLFTLLKGISRDPWVVGIFDLDLLSLLIGYLFLSSGRIHAAVFALVQGLLIDIFSSGPNGLSALSYLVVFWGICAGSLFFYFETAKGQIIIISMAVFLKHATFLAVIALVSERIAFSIFFLSATAISVLGTGLLTPVMYHFFDRLRELPEKDEDISVDVP